MATLSGYCRETNIDTMADVETLLVAFLTVQNSRMVVLGGAATKILGNLTVTCRASDAGVTSYFMHRVMTNLNCKNLAAITAVVAALEVYFAAILAQSNWATDPQFDFTISTNMTS